MMRVLYWNAHTLTVPFDTGIQRVVRNLQVGLRRHGMDVQPVGWDRTSRLMVPDPHDARGRAKWLLVPEIPMSVLSDDLDPIEIGHAYGLKTAAIVHDLIPAKFAEGYDEGARRLYDRYFRMFANADLVFATTHYVANDLRDFLAHRSLRVPEIVVVPLAAEFPGVARVTGKRSSDAGERIKLLSVSTWEPRKNLPCFLRALRDCRDADRFAMTIVGRRAGWTDYDAEIEATAATMGNVQFRSKVRDADLVALYATHDASVYPSLEEGFGLPILESLWFATPCLCHDKSSMAEVAPGGGTMMIDMADEAAIATALQTLSSQPTTLRQLARDAVERPLTSWSNYASAIMEHLER